MTNIKVDITGINTSDLKVLKNEETISLIRSFKDGNIEDKSKIVEGNLLLVLSILKRFNKVNVNKDDLFQVGVVGLIKAIDNFDLSYNLQFSTYAVYLIIGEVKRYLRDSTTLRVSRSTKDLAYSIIKFKDEFLLTNGVYPNNAEIAQSLGIDEFSVGYAMDSLKDPISMFDPIYSDGSDAIYLEDKLSNKEPYYDTETILSMKDALLKINEREKEVLIKRFIVGKTQTELANDYNISQAQVSRIEKSAINNVRKLIK